MGRIKDWLMEMEDEALELSCNEFVNKYGQANEKIWVRRNNSTFDKDFDYYNTDERPVSENNILHEEFLHAG